MKVTGKVKAYLTNIHNIFEDIEFLIEKGEVDKALARLTYAMPPEGDPDYYKVVGWNEVGEAEITLNLCTRTEYVNQQIETLREKITEVRADSGRKVAELESQIQNLLSLPNHSEGGGV